MRYLIAILLTLAVTGAERELKHDPNVDMIYGYSPQENSFMVGNSSSTLIRCQYSSKKKTYYRFDVEAGRISKSYKFTMNAKLFCFKFIEATRIATMNTDDAV